MDLDIKSYISDIARLIEVIGVLTIMLGVIIALARYALMFQGITPRSYKVLRGELGKGILLGLEILVAGDIIKTVATEPTMMNVLTLGVIVIIRTLLSLSLEVEISGKFPWQKTQVVDR